MAEIIGRSPEAGKETSCTGCGALIRYYKNDIKEINGTDYTGGADGKEYVPCPSCGYEITIRAWQLQKPLDNVNSQSYMY